MAKTESEIHGLIAEARMQCAHPNVHFHYTDGPRVMSALADELERRAANSDGGVEPVAWRYRATYGDGSPVDGWQFSEEPSLLGLYQPLYAHPPAKALDGIAVKALEWSRVGWVEALSAPEGLGVWYAINSLYPKERTPPFILKIFVGTYRKSSTSEMWVDGGTFATVEEAKAAAQADFDQRIRSAIK